MFKRPVSLRVGAVPSTDSRLRLAAPTSAMLPTPVAGALGGLLAAAVVVALAWSLGDAGALATVLSATDDGSASRAGVAAYLGYGVVAGGAFGALAVRLGSGSTTGVLAWLLGGVAWGVVLFLVGVGYRAALRSRHPAIPLRRALGYDLVFGVVLGSVVSVLA